jgi:NAD(P)-dependent dehydrogenase (short-subunit alcohol dehydrogenase family)
VDLGLKGRVAIVTGASQGIGRAIAEALIGEGCKVVNFDLREQEYGGPEYLKVDVARSEEVAQGVKRAWENYGRIDLLVNNAGIAAYGSVHELSEEEWDRVMNVNLRGAFLTSKFVIPHMLRQGKGVIVNVASIQSLGVEYKATAYSTSKHALLGLTRSIAVDYAPTIRAVAVCPGSIRTPLFEAGIAENYGRQAVEAKIAEIASRYPMARIGRPEEVGNLVAFLASDLSSFINGTCVVIDGGLTALIPTRPIPR